MSTTYTSVEYAVDAALVDSLRGVNINQLSGIEALRHLQKSNGRKMLYEPLSGIPRAYIAIDDLVGAVQDPAALRILVTRQPQSVAMSPDEIRQLCEESPGLITSRARRELQSRYNGAIRRMASYEKKQAKSSKAVETPILNTAPNGENGKDELEAMVLAEVTRKEGHEEEPPSPYATDCFHYVDADLREED